MGGCFPCFGSSNKETGKDEVKKESFKDASSAAQSIHLTKVNSDKSKSRGSHDPKKDPAIAKDGPTAHIAAQTFTFRELAAATKNFRPESLLGEGGFGRVYKGRLESTGQVVAVKQLDRNGLQGNREFLVEVLMLSLLHHPNLVNLIGYCADGDQRLLVYEFMPLGSLEDHLHDLPPDKEPLDWNTRMKIAAGAAKGLEYLHDKANPPVIYRDLKSSNILLDEGYHPKLSDFGLAKLGPVGDKTHVSTRVMGTYGYCAPEYAMTGQLTLKSDVYSFGVVFLELITGRKAIDNTRSHGEHNLVAWARPLFKDRRKFPKMADPLLQGRYPMRGLYQALAVAAMCLQEQASTRPLIGDVVTALTYLASQTYDPNAVGAQSNRVGSSTPRSREDRLHSVDGVDSPEYTSAHHGSPSIQRNSPDSRKRDSARDFNTGIELRKIATSGGSGRKWGVDESERPDSQRNSPVSAGRTRETPRNRDLDRERAVAEAKVWGENWREKKKTLKMAELVVAGPPAPPPMTFRDRLTQFRILEEKRCELIEELLDKLEKTEARLAQCELDLGSEQNVRRTLQAEIADVTRTMQGQLAESKAKEEALVQSQAKRPFVLVLIDADAEGFLFHDKYITRKAQGGESLADELNIRIREYLREQFPDDADSLDIIVRVYANLEGMANYLVRLDKVRNLGQLRAFSTGFCGRITSFDWIDTGVGKEGGAGRKVRENLSFFASNTHLRHAIVACSPVDLPASLLTTIPLEKLTLIESLPLPTSLTTMPLKTAKFHTLFPPPPPSKAPKPSRERGRNDRGLSETDVRRGDREMRRGDERGGGPQLQLMEQEHEGGGSTWLVIQPERSKSQTVSGRDRDRRRAGSEDDTSSLSISIGPDNTVQVDSGRRRRLMG